jgi:hypothetical protein
VKRTLTKSIRRLVSCGFMFIPMTGVSSVRNALCLVKIHKPKNQAAVFSYDRVPIHSNHYGIPML